MKTEKELIEMIAEIHAELFVSGTFNKEKWCEILNNIDIDKVYDMHSLVYLLQDMPGTASMSGVTNNERIDIEASLSEKIFKDIPDPEMSEAYQTAFDNYTTSRYEIND